MDKEELKRRNESTKRWRKKNPWFAYYSSARYRCNSPYGAYYGKRKFLLTVEEIKKLWFRDKPWLLKQPSINRINNDGDYTFDNCNFIERFDNCHPIAVRRFDKGRVRDFKSMRKGAMASGTCTINVSKVCRGIRKTAGGYRWEINFRRY